MRVAVWHWLLHHAAWKQTEHSIGGVKVKIKRGEVCFSQQQIQNDTGASRKQVRDVIEWLIQRKKAAKIGANERANGGAKVRANAKTILLIEKYDEYQHHDAEGANGRANGRADEGPTKEQGLTNITTVEAKASLSAKADDKAEVAEAVSLFKQVAAAQGWPSIRILSKARHVALRARLREAGGIDGWREALCKAAASNHCNGDNDRGWLCNFDFLTQQKSFAKLMEGNYDNRTPKGTTRHPGTSGSHDSLLAGFAASADHEPDRGSDGFRDSGPSQYPGDTEMDSGPRSYSSEPILRVIGSG